MITRIHFLAVWNPTAKMMNVEFSTPEKKHIELMSPKRFEEFCAKLDSEIEIAEWKVRFEPGSDRSQIEQIKDYFRAVLASYKKAKAAGDV
jgi:hypothetical protein